MDSVDLVVTEVSRLKDIIACLKGENAALKEELAQLSHNTGSKQARSEIAAILDKGHISFIEDSVVIRMSRLNYERVRQLLAAQSVKCNFWRVRL